MLIMSKGATATWGGTAGLTLLNCANDAALVTAVTTGPEPIASDRPEAGRQLVPFGLHTPMTMELAAVKFRSPGGGPVTEVSLPVAGTVTVRTIFELLS